MTSLKTTVLIISSLLIFSCQTEKNQQLDEGYYILEKIVKEGNTTLKDLDIRNGVLQVKGQDSLIFEGNMNIGLHYFDNDHFKYQLTGNKLSLFNKGQKEKLQLSFDKDSLLRIDIHDNTQLYFKKLQLELEGKYSILSYERYPQANLDTINKYRDELTEGIAFDFKDNNTVNISPKVTQFLLKHPNNTNEAFDYTLTNNTIVFSNSDYRFQLDYAYDGILHFFPKDTNFKRWDFMKPPAQ
ncbi:hypothetical protein IFO69_12690 [Echinicola sp. CAU 1574]|uniref:DUF4292 domain-containing protein n=1 Tax=Echinicola arenosa TaxID=2774144 RepID=A0ABR9ANY1_9BACT|nr:hypothetical protein [Echinicola arenosa]MBD8489605.1 hypothetical protein [Echinicola arenosa]